MSCFDVVVDSSFVKSSIEYDEGLRICFWF